MSGEEFLIFKTLVNQLEKEKQQLGMGGNLAKHLMPIDTVIRDELGICHSLNLVGLFNAF